MRNARVAVLVVAATLAGGCSDEERAQRDSGQAPPNEFSSYAVQVRARTAKGDLDLQFPPVAAVSAPRAVTGFAMEPEAGPGSKPLATVGVDGGTVDTDTYAPSKFAEGWLLLMRAVGQCMKSAVGTGAEAIAPPWASSDNKNRPDNWYVFEAKLEKPTGNSLFPTCTQILAREQVLVCAADLLQEVASTVSPVTWPGDVVAGVNFTASGLPGWIKDTWVLPPQSEKNKFIARDLALNVLANLARLDMERPKPATGPALPAGETCANAFVRMASEPAYFAQYKSAICGSECSGSPAESAEFLLRANAVTLRAAGRMLRSLIDDSVMADLAGAERQRSRAADPKRGPELFWGNQTDSSAPYNSLSHAFRVVFGRWESGRMAGWPAVPVPTADAPIPSGDPGCGVFGPIDLLTRALDPGTSARWEDRRVRKPEQQRAVQLVDKAGIVIPREKLEAADMATVKAAVNMGVWVSGILGHCDRLRA